MVRPSSVGKAIFFISFDTPSASLQECMILVTVFCILTRAPFDDFRQVFHSGVAPQARAVFTHGSYCCAPFPGPVRSLYPMSEAGSPAGHNVSSFHVSCHFVAQTVQIISDTAQSDYMKPSCHI